MKYTAEAFDEWWFTTQFDRVYWQVNSQKHQTEYKWAKLAWDAARRDLLAEVERLEEDKDLAVNVWCKKLKDQLQSAQAENKRLKEQVFFKCTSHIGLCPYVEDTKAVIEQLQVENERLAAELGALRQQMSGM